MYVYNVVDALDEVAKETGKSIPQISLNWLFHRPTVSSVIIGARNEQQLKDNLGAIGWSLSAEQIAKLDAASETAKAYPYGIKRISRNGTRRRSSSAAISASFGKLGQWPSLSQRCHIAHVSSGHARFEATQDEEVSER